GFCDVVTPGRSVPLSYHRRPDLATGILRPARAAQTNSAPAAKKRAAGSSYRQRSFSTQARSVSMKILLTSDTWTPAVNGVVTSATTLRAALQARGHE